MSEHNQETTNVVGEEKHISGKVESDRSIVDLEAQIAQLEKELESEKRKSLDFSNRMKYLQADIANLQKQTDRMVSEARLQGRLNLIMELIEIKENLERAMSTGASNSHSLIDGLGMVVSRINSTLNLEDVQVINPQKGTQFDPHLHEAVSYSYESGLGDGNIVSVIRNGYAISGKVIKPALVEVARQAQSKFEDKMVSEEENLDRADNASPPKDASSVEVEVRTKERKT